MNSKQENKENFEERFKKNFGKFEEKIKESAGKLLSMKKSRVRLVSHLDADGISSAAIIIKTLNRLGFFYSLTILPQLKYEDVKKFSKENESIFIFTDLGSGELCAFKELMPNKTIFILDHHQPQECELTDNIIHINPHNFGFNGSSEICGAGVTYLFAKAVDENNKDLSSIAILGIIGDVQDPKYGLNKIILNDAVESGNIKVIRGLRVFGAQTKPLYKALVQSSDFTIPGVTGNESGAIQFLKQIGVEPKDGSKWRRIIDLNDDELKRLVEGIIMMRLGEESPEDILGDVYLFTKEKEGSPLKDAKEFATVLNACGRMGKASYGIGACLGDRRFKKLAVSVLDDYRKEIVNGLKFFEKNRNSEYVVEEPGILILNARDKVKPTVIGTVCSIISRNNSLSNNTFLLGLSRMNDKYTKISMRYKGDNEVNLKDILMEILGDNEGEVGGHHFAAGAYIPIEFENEFIDRAKKVVNKVINNTAFAVQQREKLEEQVN